MAPTTRAAWVLVAAAVAALLIHPAVAIAIGIGLVAASIADLRSIKEPPNVRREVPVVLARGVPARLQIRVRARSAHTVRIRQPRTADLDVVPNEDVGGLESLIVGRRRGRHQLPAVAAASTGPMGLIRRHAAAGEPTDVLVYPDLPAARRLAIAVRQGRFRDPGRRTRGPLGLGTEFESIRDYLPDDDIRQVNWRVSARLGRPMSNQYRVEQDRDVICLVDSGRLMSAPLGSAMDRLDIAMDCVTAVALVAEELGDRCGVIAFSDRIRRQVRPRRGGADEVVGAVFDLEPEPVDSDYELAFRTVRSGKRAFVLVLTDVIDPAAASPLVDALPFLARKHALAVASVLDPDVDAALSSTPADIGDVMRQAVAVDVLDSREATVLTLRRAGAEVLESAPELLATRCVGAYLRAKAAAKL
jgi:uncharacterized protein (DUF58 family)